MTSTPPGPPDLREINRQMVGRILGGDPQPYADGGYVLRVLRHTGRRSGATVEVPIAVVCESGQRYLVSPTRRRNWVRNLLADPVCEIASRDEVERRTATPLDGHADADEIAAVVGTYLARMDAPWALRQFPVGRDATADDIRAVAPQLAVFRLEPR